MKHILAVSIMLSLSGGLWSSSGLDLDKNSGPYLCQLSDAETALIAVDQIQNTDQYSKRKVISVLKPDMERRIIGILAGSAIIALGVWDMSEHTVPSTFSGLVMASFGTGIVIVTW